MSLYGALFSGVSGLTSQASAMGAISDNVTNVNTIGYKSTTVKFQTLITKQVSSTKYSPGGVQSRPRHENDVQGLLQATSSSQDVALSGQGFFVVNSSNQPDVSAGIFGYTRAGSFKADKQGYLQNTGGFYMMGWPLMASDGSSSATPTELVIEGNTFMKAYKNSDGTTHYINQNIVADTELRALNVNTIGGTADATTRITMGANLPSGDTIYDANNSSTTGIHETNVLLYDSLGNSHNSTFVWEKTAQNEWTVNVKPPAGATRLVVQQEGSTSTTNFYAAGQLEFTGTFSSAAIAALSGDTFDVNFGTGAGVQTFTFSSAAAAPTTLSATIGLSGATSWTDVINNITIALGGQVSSTPTTPVNPRVTADTANNRVLVTQNGSTSVGATTAISITNFVDNNTAGLTTYLLQASTGTGGFTIPTLAAASNYQTLAALTFNGNGTPSAINVNQLDIGWANGATAMTGGTSVSLGLGNLNQSDGMTQFAGSYEVSYITQNGAKFGNFSGLSIGTDGVVQALFDNGVRRPIFQIPISTFVNPNGLESLTGNTFIETETSGSYTLRVAGEAGAGQTTQASLEASTVDLGEEFTVMITTQRAYTAAAKIITTADEMLDELVRIKR